MDSYSIEWKRSAVKELKALPKEMIARIVASVEQLADDPYPVGVKKLVGTAHTYRICEGNYRVIFDVLEKKLVIEVVRVGHRKDVYE
ncbi:MAG: type II toxin-antitoxin system RelE/ParE family toxin [Acidobacteria bacterium]|nr:type II toxin-antitoxin system RelE/ParE family toxin [Acidobacteriota bacterium]